MFQAIRKRLHVSPATAIATLALVFAMTGGAYAAKRYLITSTKQISPKVLKALKGSSGKNGASGSAGAAGAVGPAGPTGPAGAAGGKGENGTIGINGESVTNKTVLTTETACKKEGGSEFKVGTAAPTYACNGKTGYVKTLPKEATETGAWSYSAFAAGAVIFPISFPIPLATSLASTQVHYIGGALTKNVECPGTRENPEAKPGNLCVYQTEALGVVYKNATTEAVAEIFRDGGSPPAFGVPGEKEGAGTSGAGVFLTAKEAGSGWGSWAVTAP
jgi:hypothetical protein